MCLRFYSERACMGNVNVRRCVSSVGLNVHAWVKRMYECESEPVCVRMYAYVYECVSVCLSVSVCLCVRL